MLLKKNMTFGTFDAAAVRGGRGLAQTKRAAILTSGTMFFNVAVSYITIITVILVFTNPRHREYSIIMPLI